MKFSALKRTDRLSPKFSKPECGDVAEIARATGPKVPVSINSSRTRAVQRFMSRFDQITQELGYTRGAATLSLRMYRKKERAKYSLLGNLFPKYPGPPVVNRIGENASGWHYDLIFIVMNLVWTG